MKFMVGLGQTNYELLECIKEYRNHISEVYFSWGDFPSGRKSQVSNDEYTQWELMDIQRSISLEKNKEKLGCRLEVLCEGYDEECFLYYGRSRADSIDVDGKVYFGLWNIQKFI